VTDTKTHPQADTPDLSKAEVLIEALPYFQRYAGRTFVVKYGGHAMGDAGAARDFAEDIVLLKAVGINPVVVHGGGPQIGQMLARLGVESTFVDGLRVTDAATAKIAEMVLSGGINKELVSWIAAAGGKAIGISGKDGGLVTARKVTRTTRDPDSNIERVVDLGFVGEPAVVDTSVIDTAVAAGMIPVIAPIAAGADGATYNINADTMAGAIAAALGAARLFLLTDVAGVLDANGELLTDLTPADIAKLRADGVIRGGMVPKLETCISAVEAGCEAAVVLDGRVGHAMRRHAGARLNGAPERISGVRRIITLIRLQGTSPGARNLQSQALHPRNGNGSQ
jgi:acetylglutamate kinase